MDCQKKHTGQTGSLISGTYLVRSVKYNNKNCGNAAQILNNQQRYMKTG